MSATLTSAPVSTVENKEKKVDELDLGSIIKPVKNRALIGFTIEEVLNPSLCPTAPLQTTLAYRLLKEACSSIGRVEAKSKREMVGNSTSGTGFLMQLPSGRKCMVVSSCLVPNNMVAKNVAMNVDVAPESKSSGRIQARPELFFQTGGGDGENGWTLIGVGEEDASLLSFIGGEAKTGGKEWLFVPQYVQTDLAIKKMYSIGQILGRDGNMIYHNASSTSLASGSPMLDMSGRLVGIHYGTRLGKDELSPNVVGAAISIDVIYRAVGAATLSS